MRRVSWAAVVSLTLGACAGAEDEAHLPPAPEVTDTELLAHVSVPVLMPVGGSIQARERAEISTRMMARIVDVPVDIGTKVRQGQTLVRLGTPDVAAARTKAEAGLEVARAARDEAARHVARFDTLYQLDVVPLVQRDQARLALRQSEAALAVAEATLDEAVVAAGYATIQAPFSGAVVARLVDGGDLAAPGAPLVVVERSGPRDAVLAVPVEQATGLSVGDPVELERTDGTRASGTVRVVAGGAESTTRTVEVRIEAPDDWPTGAAVRGLLPAGTRRALTIPAESVIRRGQLTGVRVATDGRAQLRWVRLGRSLGDRLEVLSGLEAGERIVR
ncbi:MAG: efflux RND transporter periplasmic adaptor subunit [Gemmatimonadetes bacterium]|nr:efflux RND transporter periplasmic adaptor subunit [Gemmatimonadota bacterium]